MYYLYGPYTRPNGRMIVIHYESSTDTRRTQSYPRYLMEEHLGKELFPEEHVDHINNDHTDNRIENLQLLSVLENNRKSAAPKMYISLSCPECGNLFDRYLPSYEYGLRHGLPDPLCSLSCAGRVKGRASGVSRRGI